MFHRLTLILLFALSLLLLGPSASLAAAGESGGSSGGSMGSGNSRRSSTSESRAEKEYARGLKKRDTAWKHEKQAEEASSDKKRQKESDRAAKDWRAAVKYFRKAVEYDAKFHKAHTSLGYALRKQGEYPDSIEAYNRALAIEPSYAEAIEYRAEAYLALNQTRKAAESYMRLSRFNPEKAAILMNAMESWIREAEEHPPSDLAPDKVDWFRNWVGKRSKTASKGGAKGVSAGSW